MNAETKKQFMDRMSELLGDMSVDTAKFTLCTLVLSSLFDGIQKSWLTYAGFIGAAALCFVAGAFLTRHKNNYTHK
jgi:hypothetical protein